MVDPLPVLAVVGPTASGKTALAVEVALRTGAEIVNADSFQLYRGMDVGTAKPTTHQRRGVPHHLIDVLDIGDDANVADYQRAASAVLDAIAARGRRAILVGGSGLYVRAVLEGLEIPPTDPAVRARLEQELAAAGAAALHARLAARDPEAAAAILATNGRRVVRALEVNEITGGPFRATLPDRAYARPAVQVGLDVPREILDARIAARVERMWCDGFVDEVRALGPNRLRAGRTASRALGYAQVLRMLAGQLTEPEAKAETIFATRRFARRQESWFRRDQRVVWLPFDTPALPDRVVALATGDADQARRPAPSGRPPRLP
ncbi:MAG TPA: tRNA (adenosine(37)-N6)-dimethylallyltransferase MiaA [Kineosporiaceae bacterium]|nr:tRNA (adenosine(37)-N6)-dimethylallyltransferase MiaA [Kineosporiaceae bacterium]